jgi:hypothetical protein
VSPLRAIAAARSASLSTRQPGLFDQRGGAVEGRALAVEVGQVRDEDPRIGIEPEHGRQAGAMAQNVGLAGDGRADRGGNPRRWRGRRQGWKVGLGGRLGLAGVAPPPSPASDTHGRERGGAQDQRNAPRAHR